MSPRKPSSACSRSRIESEVPFLVLACILCAAASLAGCAARTISEDYQWTTLRTVRVDGKVEWEGRLEAEHMEIRATAEPQSIAGVGDAQLQRSVPRHQGGRNAVAYAWDLDVEKRATITRVERAWGVPRHRSVSHQTYAVGYHVVRVRPPEGWTVIPSEYRITKDTKNVDFVLRREMAQTE
jgi:hypothetical protein